MSQTVYDVGDPITSRIKLGVTPDGTTQVTVSVTSPTGATINPLLGAWENTDERVAQFHATADGTDTGSATGADGDWLVVWRITGTGANVLPKVYNVAPLPGTSVRPAWSPFLSDVADHVPYLTVDSITPGTQIYLGTFTGYTAPTDEVAQRHIDRVVAMMLPSIANISATLRPAARSVAALRAAASLARAYPRRPEDMSAAEALTAAADSAWTMLVDAAEAEGTVGGSVLTPVWYFPTPKRYADLDL
jgi:hypothetical protein